MMGGVDGSRALVRVRRAAGVLVMAASAWIAGCYQFVPVDPAAAPVGARIRADLLPAAADRVARETDGDLDGRLEGRVVQTSPDGALIVEVPHASGTAPVGVTSRPLFRRVAVNRTDLAGLQLKRLDRTRTILFVGGSAILGGFLVNLAFDTAGGGRENGGPGPDNVVVPILSIRW